MTAAAELHSDSCKDESKMRFFKSEYGDDSIAFSTLSSLTALSAPRRSVSKDQLMTSSLTLLFLVQITA